MWQTVTGGPAAQAGLRGTDPNRGVLGDVIVQAEGEPVRRLADLTNALERLGVGAEVNLEVRRGEETIRIAVPIEDIGAGEATTATK